MRQYLVIIQGQSRQRRVPCSPSILAMRQDCGVISCMKGIDAIGTTHGVLRMVIVVQGGGARGDRTEVVPNAKPKLRLFDRELGAL